jgi:hypothetical protein
MTSQEKLVQAIIENKKIEQEEMFNFLMAQKAISELDSYRKNIALKLFNKK